MNDFIEKFFKLRHYSDCLCDASNALGVEFFDGILGELYDEYFSVVIDLLGWGDGLPDDILEEFGNMLYGKEKPTQNEVKLFWQHYSK